MTSEISSDKKACVDCVHCEHVWGLGCFCIRPLAMQFDMVKGWEQPTVGLACKDVREGFFEGARTPVAQDKVCGEQAIHFRPKYVSPPEVVTKGIKDIPVNTGITFSDPNDKFEETKDNRVFWCAIIAALAFGLWCLLK